MMCLTIYICWIFNTLKMLKNKKNVFKILNPYWMIDLPSQLSPRLKLKYVRIVKLSKSNS